MSSHASFGLPRKRRMAALVSVVTMGMFSAFTTAAHAQFVPLSDPPPPGWTIQIEQSGSAVSTFTNYYTGQVGSATMPWSFLVEIPGMGSFLAPHLSGFGGPIGPPYAGVQEATTNGSFQTRLTWGGTNRPETVYVLETSTASWSARNGNATQGSGSASNGGGAAVPKTFTHYWGTSQGEEATNRKLRQFKVPASGVVEFGSPSFSASATAVIGDGASGGFHVSAGYEVAIDNRGVIITNPSMESGGNYRKGSEGTPVLNERNSDGSITVDSTIPWHDQIVLNPQGGGNSVIPAGWQLNADFIAVPAGFPTGVVDGGLLIEVNWSNSGEGTVSNGLYNKWDTQLTIPTVPQEFASSQPYPKDKTSSVRVKVSDKRPGLEADAENSYTIRWHVPFEGWHTIGATKRADRWIMATIDSEPEELNMNANVEYTWYDEEANIMEYAFWESLVVVLGGSGDAVTAWFRLCCMNRG